MNENLLRDLHQEEMEELKNIKALLAKLEQKKVVTPEDIEKLSNMIANVKGSALGDDEVKELFKNLSGIIKDFNTSLESHGKNLQDVKKLSSSIKEMKSSDSLKIAQGIKDIKAASDNIDINVGNYKLGNLITLSWAMFMTIACCCILYQAETLKSQVAHLKEDSVKYRYIKMKGEASPKRIAELEEIFDYNRNPTKIREIYKVVSTFEEAVRKKAIADEKARLQLLESQRLSQEANKLKQK